MSSPVTSIPSTGSEPSDRQLADRVHLDGDEAAFRQLYRRHTPRLYRFVLRLVGGSDRESEDIVQDTWVRAIQGLPKMNWRSAFATWLGGIALNRVREERKRSGRWQFDDLEGVDPIDPPNPSGERIDLERAIRELPLGYRTVLILHDLEGMTHDEIARRCQINVGTSRSQLFHARRAIRRWLTQVPQEIAKDRP